MALDGFDGMVAPYCWVVMMSCHCGWMYSYYFCRGGCDVDAAGNMCCVCRSISPSGQCLHSALLILSSEDGERCSGMPWLYRKRAQVLKDRRCAQ